MAITSGFFNSLNGDRVYNADQMSEYYKGIISNGVLQNYGCGLQVLAGSGMNVNVQIGRAFIESRWVELDAAETVNITASHATLNRYTAVCVKLDLSAREMTITTVDGTPATNAVQPTIANTETVKYLVLAWVYVPAGSTAITQVNITDTRANTSICGYVSGVVDQVDTTDLFEQWNAYFDEQRARFDAWFSALTEDLNVNTYIEKYEKNITGDGSTKSYALDMSGYTYSNGDIINVYINGLRAVNGTDYTVTTSGTPTVTFAYAYSASDTMIIEVYKSKIGFAS